MERDRTEWKNDICIDEVTSDEQVETTEELADIIWKEHYTPIIGAGQVTYMLEKFQSKSAIQKDLKNKGTRYYLISREVEPIGYIGIKFEADAMFLSKLYILAIERGNGAGKQAIDFLLNLAKENQFSHIHLTVNKDNTPTIAAYKKMGFAVVSDICADIGNGYVMDDYKMVLDL